MKAAALVFFGLMLVQTVRDIAQVPIDKETDDMFGIVFLVFFFIGLIKLTVKLFK